MLLIANTVQVAQAKWEDILTRYSRFYKVLTLRCCWSQPQKLNTSTFLFLHFFSQKNQASTLQQKGLWVGSFETPIAVGSHELYSLLRPQYCTLIFSGSTPRMAFVNQNAGGLASCCMKLWYCGEFIRGQCCAYCFPRIRMERRLSLADCGREVYLMWMALDSGR